MSDKNSTNNLFDILIPVGPEDREIVTKQIEFTKKILSDIEIFI